MTNPESPLSTVVAAEQMVARLTKPWKRAVALLAVVVVLLVASAVAIGINAVDARQLSDRIQQGAVASCISSNAVRSANVQLWDGLLSQELKDNAALLASPQFKALEAAVNGMSDTDSAKAPLEDILKMDSDTTGGSAAKASVAAFEKYIAQHEQPENCGQLYGK